MNDTGIASYYGSHKGVLELTAAGAVAIYGDKRIPVPLDNAGREDYLRAVIDADSNNAQLKARLVRMLAPSAEGAVDSAGQIEDEQPVSVEANPGICQ